MRVLSFRSPLALAFAAALLLVAPSALAQDKSAADLRTEAKAALDRNEIPAACVLYEQAYQAAKKAPADDPGPKPNEILFDLADCHEKQGYATLAASEFEQIAQAGGAQADVAKG